MGDVYHITSKPVDIDGHGYALELVTKLDDVSNVNRREALIHEHERNIEIINILASEYLSVYYVDLDKDDITSYSTNDSTRSFLKMHSKKRNPVNFSKITYAEYVTKASLNIALEDREAFIKVAIDSEINAHLSKPININELVSVMASFCK